MKSILTLVMHPIRVLKFARYLWQTVKYDGTGHRITPFYAIMLAGDEKFWNF